ncbi:Ig-like domain-containing protein, partial [Pseudomonas sp. MDT1-17]
MQLGWTGQALMVPRQSSGESRLYPAYITHTLAAGETLGSLAVKVNRSEPELRRLNAMVLGEPTVSTLQAGEVLLIPAVAQQSKAIKGSKAVQGIDSPQNQQDFETLLAKMASDAGNAYERQARNSRQGAGNFFAQHGATSATNALTNLMSSSVEEALAPYGRAKIGLRANARTNDVDLSVDYLHPIAQSDKGILFAQVGTRTFDNRNLANVGVGYRRLVNPDLMLGGNTFFDHDFTRSHTRAGVGLEMWGNSARLATNAYAPIGPWKKSDQQRLNSDPNRLNLFERPAAGWDARAEALIPGVPQLSATAQYFQWKGQGVDAFGAGKLKKDPAGHGVGLKWQPMPLLGFTSEHQRLQGGGGQFTFGMNLNWSFDRDLKKQTRSEQSAAMRPLVLAKQDFVDRNYNVVLNYEEQAKYRDFGFISQTVVVQASSPSGTPVTQASPTLRGTPTAGIVRYELANNTALVTIDPQSGVITVAPGAESQQVTVIARLFMPRLASLDGSRGVVEKMLATTGDALRVMAGFFIDTAYAAENQGIPQNYIEVADTSYHLAVIEGQLVIGSIELAVVNDRSPANGSTLNMVSANVWDDRGNPVADTEVSFTLTNSMARDTQVAVTDAGGVANLSFASQVAGKVTVTGEANSQAHAVDVHFIPDVGSAKLTLSSNKDEATAGKDEVILSGTLIDENKNPVGGVTVGFDATIEESAEKKPTVLRSFITDEQGRFRVTLRSDYAGRVWVTARIDSELNQEKTVSEKVFVLFRADQATARIVSLTPVPASGDVAANGQAVHSATATVTDEQGNLLSGAQLTFEHADSVSANAAQTGTDGTTLVTFTSKMAGEVKLTAKVGSSSQAVTLSFVADAATPYLRSLTMVTTGNKTADGKDQHEALAILEDGHGNLLSGATLTFTEVEGLTPASGASDEHGQLEVKFASTASGPVVLTAKAANGLAQTVKGSFVADAATPHLRSLTMVTTGNKTADGKDQHEALAILEDGHGNLLSGATLTFTEVEGLTPASGASDEHGQLEVKFASTASGPVVLTAKAANGLAQTVKGSFVADAATPYLRSLTMVTTGNKTADGKDQHEALAILEDGHGNLLSGATLTFTEVEGLTPASGASDEHGQLEVKFASTASGPVVLTAKAANGLAQTVKGSFVADAATPYLRSLTMVTTGNKTADGKDQHEALAILEDGHGNLLSGATLTFTEVEGLTPASGASDEHGQLEVKFASTASGPVVLTAKAANGLAQTVEGSFVADAATPHLRSLTMVTTGNKTADGKDQHEALAILEDGHGNLLSGATLTFTEVEGLTPASGASDEHGQLEVKFASTASGPVVLTAKAANGLAQTVKGSFVADAATPHLRSLTMVTTGNKTADGKDQHEALAILEDGHGNLLSGATLTFTEVEGLTPASGASDEHGQLEVKFASTASGPVVLTAKAANGLAQTVKGSFVADAATPHLRSLTMVTTGNKTADGKDQHEALAILEDGHGNLLSGATLTFTEVEGLTPASGASDEHGQLEVKFASTASGPVVLTAKAANGLAQTVEGSFVADAATPHLRSLTMVTTGNKTADGKDQHEALAILEDGHGNLLSGATLTFTEVEGLTPASGASDEHGQLEVKFASTASGPVVLTAKAANGLAQTVKGSFVADAATPHLRSLTMVTTGNKTADGKDQHEALAILEDGHGNLLSGATLTFTEVEGLTPASGASDEHGQLEVKFASTASGPVVLTAKAANGLAQTVEGSFVADAATPHLRSLTMVTTGNKTADGKDQHEALAILEDGHGNLLSGATLTFTEVEGLTPASGASDEHGQLEVKFASTASGPVVLTAKAANGLAQTVKGSFVADAATPHLRSLTMVTTGNKTADGKDQHEALAILEDGHGNLLSGATLTFTEVEGLTPASGASDEHGQLEVKFASTASGPVVLTAKAANGLAQTVEGSFVADAATPHLRSLTMVTTGNKTADGKDQHEALAILEDGHGNLLSGATLTFTEVEGLTPASGASDEHGQLEVKFASTASGPVVLTAKAANGLAQTVKGSFVADAATPHLRSLTMVTTGNKTADGKDQHEALAILEDGHGNLLSGATLTFTEVEGLTPASGASDEHGQLEVKFASTASGPVVLTAKAANGLAQTVKGSFVADAATPHLRSLTMVTTGNKTADGKDQHEALAILEDGHGNLLSGATLTFTEVEGLTPASGASDEHGQLEVKFASTASGPVVLTAKAANGLAQTVKGSFVADAATPHLRSLTMVTTGNKTADGKDQHEALAILEDGHGNLLSGATLTFTEVEGLTPASGASDEHGQLEVKFASTASGPVVLTAKAANGLAQTVKGSFVADAATPHLRSLTMVTTGNKTADGKDQHEALAILEDGHGNLLSGATLTFTEVEGLTPASGASDEHGQLEVKFASTASGPVVLTAKAANGLAQTVEGSFVADAATPHLRSLTMVTTGNKTADGKDQHEALAILEDGHGNLLSGATLTFTEVEGLTPASGASDEHGQLEVKFASTASGPVVLTAKAANGLAQTVKGSFVADAATPHLRSLTMVTTGNKTADGKDQHEALAILEDGHGNLLSGATLTFTEVEGLTPASGASDEHGQLEVKFASTASGPVVLTAKAANGLAQTVKGSFVADAATPHLRSLTMVTTGNKTADGKDQHEALAILEDGHGNLLSGATLTFTEVEGLTPASGASDEHGQLEVKFASTASGPVVLTAKAANGLAQTVEGSFVADAATPHLRSLTMVTTGNKTADGKDQHEALAILEDGHGNLLSGATLTFTEVEGLTPASGASDEHGQLEVKFASTASGPVVLTAKAANGLAQTVKGSFVADAATPHLRSLTMVTTGNKTADGKDQHEALAILEDGHGNLLSGATLTFTEVEGLTPASGASDEHGQLEVKFASTASGPVVLTAKAANGLAQTVKGSFVADAATPHLRSLTMVTTGNKTADGKDQHEALAILEDGHGNLLSGATLTFTEVEGLTPASGASDEHGQLEVKFASTASGPVVLTAKAANGLAQTVEGSFVADAATPHLRSLTMVTTGNKTADGKDQHEALAILEDGHGNLLSGATLTFTEVEGLTPASGASDEHGQLEVKFASTASGPVVLTAKAANGLAQTVKGSFVADAATPHLRSLTMVTTGNKTADGKDQHEALAILEDGHGNLLSGATLTFTEVEGLTPASGASDEHGQLEVKFASTASGPVVLTAKAANGLAQTVKGSFVADAATPHLRSLTMVTTGNKTADGKDQHEALAILEDGHGNLLSGATLTFTEVEGLTPASGASDEHGQLEVKFASTASGPVVLTAKAANGLAQTVKGSFVADAATPHLRSLTMVTTGNKTADGKDQHEALAILEDGHGNLLSGATLTFTEVEGLTPASGASDEHGQLEVKFASTASGPVVLTAKAANGLAQTVEGSFVADAATPHLRSLTMVTTGNKTADGKDQHEALAILEDGHGNLLSGATLTFTEVEGLTPASGASDEHGQLEVKFASTASGPVVLTAKAANGLAQTVKGSFVADAA